MSLWHTWGKMIEKEGLFWLISSTHLSGFYCFFFLKQFFWMLWCDRKSQGRGALENSWPSISTYSSIIKMKLCLVRDSLQEYNPRDCYPTMFLSKPPNLSLSVYSYTMKSTYKWGTTSQRLDSLLGTISHRWAFSRNFTSVMASPSCQTNYIRD